MGDSRRERPYLHLNDEDTKDTTSPKLDDHPPLVSSSSSSLANKTLGDEEEPFPWKVALSVYLIVLSDGLAYNIVSPFLAQMTKEKWGVSEDLIGVSVGFLLGIFSISRFCTGFIMGHLSDLYGRKPLLQLGLLTSGVISFFFPMAPAFWVAFFLRMLLGLFNSNVSISKSTLSDVTKPGKVRALSFAYLGASFALARVIGSTIGGFTVGVKLSSQGFMDDPYFLPCFIASVTSLLAIIPTQFFIPSGRPVAVQITPSQKQSQQSLLEETINNDDEDTKSPKVVPLDDDKSEKASEIEPLEDDKKKSDSGAEKKTGLIAGLKMIARDRLMRKLILVSSIQSYCNGSIVFIITVFPALDVSKRGLGYSPSEIGILFFIFGVVGFLFQTICFKKLLSKFNVLQIYEIGVLTLAASIFLAPFSCIFFWFFGQSLLTRILTWAWVGSSAVGLALGFMMCLPILNPIFSNVSDPSHFGLIQGTSQSTMDLTRSLGPILSGPMFSLSVLINIPFITFWILAIGLLCCWWIMKNLTPPEQRRCKGEESEEFYELEEVQVTNETK